MSGDVQQPGPRLLLIAPWLATGGADKFNLDLVGQLSKAGWDVSIATTRSGDHSWSPLFARYTQDIVSLPEFLRLPDYPGFLRDFIGSRAVDTVLISHSEIAYKLLPYLKAHTSKVVFIDYCHLVEPTWRNGGYARLAIEYQSLLDLNVVSSRHLKSWMVAQGGIAERIEVSYTGIDTDEWHPDATLRARVRQELALAEDTPVLLFTGRICAQKQPHVLARTVARLRDQNLKFVALIAGDGPDLDWLRGFVMENSLDPEVRLLGGVPNARVKELMAAADVFFLPSAYEGIALSIYEAMASALPTVTADVGGQRELLTQDCGVLIPRGREEWEVEEYAKALSVLLSDRSHGRRMGETGRARVNEHFRIDQMGSRMVEVLAYAQRLHEAQPRTQPSLAAAARSAQRAIKAAQLFEKADVIWSVRRRRSVRVRAYRFVARQLEGWYRWGERRGWDWVPRLRARIRLAVLGRV